MTSSISQTMSGQPMDPGSAPPSEAAGGASPGRLARLSPWTVYGIFIGLGLVLGAVTLLVPSTPSYDPWCWLVWGREILHGSLHTQGGASWKPLPVIFTTVLAIFGKAQPNLWLIIARAGFVVTVLMSAKLAARVTAWLTPRTSTAPLRSLRGLELLAAVGPATLAGLIALFAVALSGGWLSNSTLGYSEALAVAFLLIGFERHIDGHHRQAFVCGLVAALDRPEIWAFWGPYGLWLMWKDKQARALVVGLGLLTIVLWFLPQKLGGGSFVSGVARATHPRANSNAFASFPFWAEFKAAWTESIFRVKVAAIFTIVVGLGVMLYERRSRRRFGGRLRLRLTPLQRRSILVGAISGIFGFAWWALISLETQAGFSGNGRYLTIGAASVDIAGAIGYGVCALLLAQLPTLWVPADRQRLNLPQRASLGTAVLAAFFLFFPNFVPSNFINLGAFHGAINYQASLRRDVSTFISRHGGPRALQNCGAGEIMVEGFQVPMVAWYMNERTRNIFDQPSDFETGGPWPNVIMQDRDTRHAALLPTWQQINSWTARGARYRIITSQSVRFFVDCSPQPDDPKVPTSS
ncbi:MAG TPA: hypothetical protein VFN48_09345 [Solirubrobacteraceae bacterium]|nr:hypothetical protein [Solirubrobacteraceae bacterium]